jgi:hypothetical protein
MSQHRQPRRSASWRTSLAVRQMPKNILWGLAAGAALALFFVGVGLVRFVAALAVRRHVTAAFSVGDLTQLVYYVAGCMLAGAVVGAVGPFLRSTPARYALGAIAGAIWGICLTVGVHSVGQLQHTTWLMGAGLGVFFGLVGAYAYHSKVAG